MASVHRKLALEDLEVSLQRTRDAESRSRHRQQRIAFDNPVPKFRHRRSLLTPEPPSVREPELEPDPDVASRADDSAPTHEPTRPHLLLPTESTVGPAADAAEATTDLDVFGEPTPPVSTGWFGGNVSFMFCQCDSRVEEPGEYGAEFFASNDL